MQPYPAHKGESHIAHAEKLGLDGIYIGKEFAFNICFTKEGVCVCGGW